MKPLLPLLFLLLFAAAEPVSAQVRLKDGLQVKQESQNVVLSWETIEERGVRAFKVYRRSLYTNNQFVELSRSLPPHGPGKVYRLVDDQVYKTSGEMVHYQLVAVYEDGDRHEELSAVPLNYTSTAVRRTWGSIKAMFQ